MINTVPEEIREQVQEALLQVPSDEPSILIPGLRVSEFNDRITMRVDAYWETLHESLVGDHVVACKLLDTRGIEPYIRKQKVTETLVSLNLGDISREDVGYVLLVNLEGIKTGPRDRAEISKRVVLFNDFEIHPFGMPFLGHVKPTGPLTVQCLHGQATLQVHIFPR